MKNNTVYIIAALLILVGLCMIGATAASVGFSPEKLSTVKYTDGVYTAENEVSELTVEDSNTTIYIESYSGDRVKIEYVESDREKYTINQSGDSLTVEKHVTNVIYNIFNIDLTVMSREIKIYIPENTEVKVKARTSNASIKAESIDFTALNLRTSNGKIALTDVNCAGAAEVTTSNSSIILENLNVSDELSCSTSNGGITLTNITALTVDADSSNASISLDSIKAQKLNAETGNGRIEVSGLNVSDEIRLDTSNSSISGTLPGSIANYDITSSTSNGSNSLPDNSAAGDIKLVVRTSNGSIRLEFEND
jgi:hypothetical protein